MPADHSRGFHDEEHVGEASAVEHLWKHREDRPVGLGELRSVELALEHEQLVTQSEDLRVALIAGRKHPSEA